MFGKYFKFRKKSLFVFLIFISFFAFVFFKSGYNLFYTDKLIDINLESIKSNRVIIIGDSRFKRIVRERDKYVIPSNFFFIAESAKDIKWFKKEALSQLYKMLDNNYLYHVVINMGVNDIQFTRPFDDDINSYKAEFKKLIKKYPNVKFYYLSINPIEEDKMNYFYPENRRTNSEIMFFNNEMHDFTIKNNIKYCSSFDDVLFNTTDGIHYDEETNQRIINYINNKCVVYDLLGNRWNYE